MNDIVSATSLTEGDLIKVRITAINVQGNSEVSDLNTSGVTVKVKPQTPTTAPTRNALTSASQLVVDFGPLDSSLNGGSSVTSYILEILVADYVAVIGESSDSLATTATATSPDFTITSGQRYTFRWRAKNIFGTSDPSPTVQVLAASKPAQPDAAILSVLANGNVKVAWTDPTNTGGDGVLITDYIVTILKKDGSYVEDTSLCDGSVEPALSDLSCEITFANLLLDPFLLTQGDYVKAKFQVKNEIDWSDFSPEVSDGNAVTVQVVPHKPTSPRSSTGTSSSQVVVEWDTISSPENGGSDITSYNLQFDQGTSGATWQSLIGYPTESTALTYTYSSSVEAGKTYNFILRAKNIQGWGPYSDQEGITAATVPDDISTAVTTSLSGSKVVFTWDVPFNGGLPITSYTVEFRLKDGSFATSAECVPTAGTQSGTQYCEVEMNTFTLASFNLVIDDLIVARVKATSSIGPATGYSPINTSGVTVRTIPLKPPTAPSEGSSSNDSQIEIVITAVTGTNTGSSTILSYEIYWDGGSSVASWTSLTTITATGDLTQSYTQTTGITVGETYQYKYRATNVYGSGEFSDTTPILASNVPSQMDPPTLALNSLNVDITWTAPDNRGSLISKYRITFLDKADSQYKEVESFCGLAESSPTTGTSCTVAMEDFGTVLGYSKGELLLVKVEAYNAEGYSTSSTELTSGLVFQSIPSQVTNLVVTSTSSTEVSLTWDAITSSPNNGYSSITEYEVWWNSGSGSTLALLTSAGNTNTYSKSSLTTGTTYRFAVLAKNVHGAGPLSSEQSILVAAVPEQMTQVSTSDNGTDIVFAWAAPTSNNGAEITAYRVNLYVKDSGYQHLPTLCDASNVSVMTCVVPMSQITSTLGYTGGELILATAEAFNVKGWSTPSEPNTSGEVAKVVPIAPTGLAATVQDTTSIDLTWTAISLSPDNGYSPVTSYTVYSNQGSGSTYTSVKTTTTNSVSLTGLKNGYTYKFKVSASNLFGEGESSSSVSSLLATAPLQMSAPVVQYSLADVMVSFAYPTSGGQPVTDFEIQLSSDGTTFTEIASLCDGSSSSVQEQRVVQ